MNHKPTSLVTVSYSCDDQKHRLGQLALKDKTILFEYDTNFVQSGLELSPFKLPLKYGVFQSSDRLFQGLFGLFNDSLPDGWGQLLLDRKLLSLGLHPNTLSPLDRLCYVGTTGMGALIYEPENPHALPNYYENLDRIADEVKQFQANDDSMIDELLSLNGSSAGARPKAVIDIHHEKWLVKFRSHTDPMDMGNIEYAYHLMAQSAGLDLPEAKLFESNQCGGYFGTKRFDISQNKRKHMHTMSGLLHADHHLPCLDYETILKTTLYLTRDKTECEKQFRAAVFNVLTHNRDDHAKNFSFLMNAQGQWFVSPAYDLTFSSGPNGEHCSMIMGEGKRPTRQHLIQLARIVDIKEANHIIDEVIASVEQWQTFAKAANVDKQTYQTINKLLKSLIQDCSR